MDDSFLQDLNPPQRDAVTHGEGPMLILAGAGSGKTRTITYRIAHLIQQRICPPDRILAVTFTNKAAEEMRNRVLDLLPPMPAAPLVCTFHSLGVRILRRFAERLGYRTDFAICDVDDQKRIYKSIYQDLGLSEKEIPIRQARAAISHAKNRGWGPERYEREQSDFDSRPISEIFHRYQRYLKQSNAVDFDDLLLLTVELLRENDDLRSRYSDWYRFLLIDEYQDTNAPQYDLVKLLTDLHQNVCAVGDEDQSIYGFRGADISNILRFESDFPGARLIKLEQNYRSSQVVLDAASSVVANNVDRKGKKLWTADKGGERIGLFVASDSRAEAAYVAEKIQELGGGGSQGNGSHSAILYRANFLSREFEEALNRRAIPYRLIGGVSFYARKEVKDAIAYLRLTLNPDDNVSLLRIINEPARGIGKTTLSRLQQIARQSQVSLGAALASTLRDRTLAPRAHKALARFALLMDECRSKEGLPLHLLLDHILEASGYRDALNEEGSEEAESRLLNLDELVKVARENAESEQSIQDFLDHAALRADTDDYDVNAAVTLMTLHNAKGLEFDTVFLAGCEEGLFPHQRSIESDDVEEERRLCYVGLTRARRRLQLSYSRRRRLFGSYDSNAFNIPSRFLNEIPQELLEVHSSPELYGSPFESDGFGPSPRDRGFVSNEPFQTPTRSAASGSGAASAGGFLKPASPKGKSPFAGLTTYDTKESIESYLKHLPDRPAAKADTGGRIRKGIFVVHGKYGRGRVLQVQPMQDDLKVTVQFPGVGIKKLFQKYAKLKPI